MSVPLGGTISTMVTKSPLANFCPRRERCSIGTAGIGTGPVPLLTCATAVLDLASPPPRGDFITRILSGVVSQHPPTSRPPAGTKFFAYLAHKFGQYKKIILTFTVCADS